MAATKANAKVRTKRKERKNVSAGAAHIQSTFNNTIVTITDTAGQHDFVVQHGYAELPRLPQEHSLRRPERCRSGCQGRDGTWHEDRRGLRQGPRFRP